MGKINKNCGIYQVRNIVTMVCYSGQSIHLKKKTSRTLEHIKKK